MTPLISPSSLSPLPLPTVHSTWHAFPCIIFTRLILVSFPQISLVYWRYHLLKRVEISQVLQTKRFHQVTENDGCTGSKGQFQIEWIVKRVEWQMIWSCICNFFSSPKYKIRQWVSGRCAYRIGPGYKGSKKSHYYGSVYSSMKEVFRLQ